MPPDAPNRIDAAFARLQQAGRKGLWPYLTAGYPDLETMEALLEAFDRLGVAGVEVGIPYSDPVADGPVIQTSYSRVLDAGITLADIFERPGRLGNMLFMVRETKYINQFDKVVALQRSTGISYKPS